MPKKLKKKTHIKQTEGYIKLHKRIRKGKKRATKVKDYRINSFLTTNVRLGDYTSVKPAVRSLLKNDQNYKNLVKAIQSQNKGFFNDVEYNENLVGLKTSMEKMVDFISGRLLAARDEGRKRGIELTIPDLIEHEFRTEAYISFEERVSHNLNKIFSKRIPYFSEEMQKMRTGYLYNKQRQILKEQVGTSDFLKMDLKYLNELPLGMPKSSGSMGYGYAVTTKDGEQIVFEMVRRQVGNTEYMMNLVMHYKEGNKWKSIEGDITGMGK